ncbi:hypothetical protein BLOT_014798 [Blomia tropicalis]|nr:hypothetical protein BLOT_014798 [Blomia tropicalis]
MFLQLFTFIIILMKIIAVETGYHFQDEQIKEVETYINKQWNTFWSSYANDQLNRKLYILVIMGSIIQTRLAIKASHHVFTNFDFAYFLVINDLKTPGIEDNQFEFETISYINDPRYHRYFRDLHYKELQFINKKVIIPKELKILFNNIYDTENQTYLETFYPFYVSLVLFSRIKKMEKAPHYELNKLAIVFNRAIFLVTVLPRFDEIFHFLIVECDGDLGDIWSYGQDGPIDVESFKLSLKKNERIFLLKEIVHGTLLAVLIPIIYYKFVIKKNKSVNKNLALITNIANNSMESLNNDDDNNSFLNLIIFGELFIVIFLIIISLISKFSNINKREQGKQQSSKVENETIELKQ